MVASIDLMPSLLQLAGVEWYTEFHGHSFIPLLKNQSVAWRNSLLIEYFEERVAPRCPRYFAVRTDDWKYIHYPDLVGMDELYHLANDPGEQTNVIGETNSQKDLADLKQDLRELSKQSGNPFSVFEN